MISVLDAEKLSVLEIEAFLGASESVRFAGQGHAEIYQGCKGFGSSLVWPTIQRLRYQV
jgi:hypothetical protein